MPQALYFIAVLPPEPIREQVRELKLELQRRFGAGHALKSPAHITLQMPFRIAEHRGEELESLLRAFAGQQTPFPVAIRGFDCFPPRVIFLRIEDHDPWIPLQHALKSVLTGSRIIPEKAAQHPFHPHMTIATRDLTPVAFEKAWPEFEERSFQAGFTADSLSLLKHNGRHWEILRQYAFDA